MQNRKYPIGVQDFDKLVSNDFLYIDKTEIIFKLLEPSTQYYFFSRPRRFGKSLLISTLKEIFLGNQHLFKNTWIYDKIAWEKFPVIHISFSMINFGTLGLERALSKTIHEIANEYEIELEQSVYAVEFSDLIVKLSKKMAKPIVILIDEYDKPITNYLEKENLEQAKENSEVLRQLYEPIKDLDKYLRFFILTGVSKFSKTSIFSTLNHLADISLMPDFNNLVGISQAELDNNFSEAITDLAKKENISYETCRDEIKLWYDGYNWCGDDLMYNPFSILQLFSGLKFDNFWINSGGSKFLLSYLQKDLEYQFEDFEVDAILFASYDLENLDYRALLFQTGYLTIKAQPERGAYILGYPNREVKSALSAYIAGDYANIPPSDIGVSAKRMARILRQGNLAEFEKILDSLFARIPEQLFRQNYENFYHAIIYNSMLLLSVHVQAEVSHRDGRTDMLIVTDDFIYVLEFKVNKKANAALNQIQQKNYIAPYIGLGKKIYKIGITFSKKKKGIYEFKAEEVI